MGQLDADLLGALDDRGRRRGAGDLPGDPVIDAAAQFLRCIDQHRIDDRRAAHMRHVVVADRLQRRLRLDAAQADVGAGTLGHRPREAPAVAVEHRQRPEIHRVRRHVPVQDVADRVQIRAAMVIDDALRIARRARRVVQRDRVPLVCRRLPGVVRIAFGQKRLVVDLAQRLAALIARVVDVDHQRPLVQQRQRLLDRRGELAVGDQRAGAAMAQHEGDRLGVEPRVQRVQHRAAHRHAEMRLVHRRDVRRHHRDRVVLADAAPRQRRCQTAAARVGLAPGEALRAMHDRGCVRIDVGRALQEGQRRQRRVVGLVAVEPSQIGAVAGHAVSPARCHSMQAGRAPPAPRLPASRATGNGRQPESRGVHSAR